MTPGLCHFFSFPTRQTSEDLPPPTPTARAEIAHVFPCVVGVRLLQSALSLHYTRGIVYSLHLFYATQKKASFARDKRVATLSLDPNPRDFQPRKNHRAESRRSFFFSSLSSIFSPDQRDRFSLWIPFSTLRFLDKDPKITRFLGVADGEFLYF